MSGERDFSITQHEVSKEWRYTCAYDLYITGLALLCFTRLMSRENYFFYCGLYQVVAGRQTWFKFRKKEVQLSSDLTEPEYKLKELTS